MIQDKKILFEVHIGDNVIKFSFHYDRLCLSKTDNKFSRKVAEEGKSRTIEGLKKLQNVKEDKNGISELQYKR